MRTARRIARNALVLLGSDVARLAFGLFLTVTVARRLGVAALGDLAYVLALVSMLTVITDAGLSQFYVRFAQTDATGATLGAVLVLRVIAATLGAAGLAAYSVTTVPHLRSVLLLGSLLLWLSIPASWVTTFLRAREQMGVEGIAKVSGSAFTAAGALVVMSWGFGVTAVMGVMVGVSAVTSALFFWIGFRRMPKPITLLQPVSAYVTILRQAWPFAALAIFGTIYFRIDAVMLYALRGQEALGQYSAAYRMMETALLLPWVLSAAALPPVVRYLHTRMQDVIVASRHALQLLFAVSVPAAILGAVLAPELFGLLYGPSFAEAAAIFRILAFTLVAVCASVVTSTLIAAGPRPMVNAWLALLMVVENVGLNLIVIPRWGGAGAAAATLMTETTGLVLGTLYLGSKLGPLRYWSFGAKPAIAALAAASVAMLHPSLFMLPLYFVVYVATMWLVRGITASDVSFIRGLLARSQPNYRPGDA